MKTITLHHPSSGEDEASLALFRVSRRRRVRRYPTSGQSPFVRCRGSTDMMNVLEKYDREPASVVLNFQLVAAEPTNTRDPAVAGIDSPCGTSSSSRAIVLGTAVATTGENHMVTQTIAGDSETLSLIVSVSDVRVEETTRASTFASRSKGRPFQLQRRPTAGRGRPPVDGRHRPHGPDGAPRHIGQRKRPTRPDPHRPPPTRQALARVFSNQFAVLPWHRPDSPFEQGCSMREGPPRPAASSPRRT